MPSPVVLCARTRPPRLTAICLRQLRRTCDSLAENGVQATAVVIADDENLDTARELGFGTVDRDNRFISRRFNDGIQLACDPEFNPRPADYVVPLRLRRLGRLAALLSTCPSATPCSASSA